MRSFLFGLAIAIVLIAGAVAFRLVVGHLRPGLAGCPRSPAPGPIPGHPAPVPLTGSYFHTGTAGANWGSGIPQELPLDLAAMRRGAGLYARDCRSCHGALGQGDGIMTRIPGGIGGVADLQDPAAAQAPDGEIFAVVTRGKGKMIGYGDTIPANDRWAIVAYLRALQASQHGTAADLKSAPPSTSAPAAETGLGAPTAAEAARLASYGWIDRKAGTVHIPIERAMETTLERLRAGQPSAPVPAGPSFPLP